MKNSKWSKCEPWEENTRRTHRMGAVIEQGRVRTKGHSRDWFYARIGSTEWVKLPEEIKTLTAARAWVDRKMRPDGIQGEFTQSPRIRENERKGGAEERCVACGKPLRGLTLTIQLFGGGASWAENEVQLDEDDAGYMGVHPIGADCFGRLRRESKAK